MTITHYEKKQPLDSNLEDFIITSVDLNDRKKDKNKLIAFSVIQIHYAGKDKYEIIKFDTAHGYCHVHRFYKSLTDKGGEVSGGDISPNNFDKCRKDIKQNWRKYKEWYLRRWTD